MEIELEKKFTYRVCEQDTLNSICIKFNTCKENILRNNNEIPLYAGEIIEITLNDFVIHIIKPTETLESVARIYNISCEELKNLNNLNNNKLFIGSVFVLAASLANFLIREFK